MSTSRLTRFLSCAPPFQLLPNRGYAFKSDLHIKWVRPEKIHSTRPEKSGDLEPIAKIAPDSLRVDFRDSEELKTADEVVKKLFTLEFAPRNETIKAYKEDMLGRVKRHPLDSESIEAKIALWTGTIRSLQVVTAEVPTNRQLKVVLKNLIDKRRKRLKFLRMWDYKKFEWLIEKLNIVYKPMPLTCIPVTRKDSLRKLTKKYCDEIRTRKLEAYKRELQAQQPAFLEEKIRTLQYIRDEQKRLEVPITVTQEEIDAAKKLLSEMQAKKVQQEADAED